MKLHSKFLFFSCVILMFFITSLGHAQDSAQPIVAKLKLIQKKSTSKNSPFVALCVTFVNDSDEDVYIPAILNSSRYPSGGIIRTSVKKGKVYQPDGSFGKTIPDKNKSQPGLINTVSGSRNEIIDEYAEGQKEQDEKQQQTLADYEKASKNEVSLNRLLASNLKPLFLKAHEEFEIYLVKDVDKLLELPYEFKVEYFLDYTLDNLDKYPDKIFTYRKVFPKVLRSNILYIQTQP